jgi:hypothetical protein
VSGSHTNLMKAGVQLTASLNEIFSHGINVNTDSLHLRIYVLQYCILTF